MWRKVKPGLKGEPINTTVVFKSSQYCYLKVHITSHILMVNAGIKLTHFSRLKFTHPGVSSLSPRRKWGFHGLTEFTSVKTIETAFNSRKPRGKQRDKL
jgi:hypothetical protein